MKKLKLAEYIIDEKTQKELAEYWEAKGIPDMINLIKDELKNSLVYINDKYQVAVRKNKIQVEGWPDMIHLSIKTLNKDVSHDWRDFQEIKNQLVGEECEAVELYPAESRLVDTANQYHLWCFAKAGIKFPFGFTERLVNDDSVGGCKQRPRN